MVMNWHPDEGQAEYEYNMNAQAEYEMQMEAEAAQAEAEMEIQREKEQQINELISQIEDDIRHHEHEIGKLQERIHTLQNQI